MEKVRSLQELVAHQQAAQAKATARDKALEVDRCRQNMAQLDSQMLESSQRGVSAATFMMYQGLRELHSEAIVRAQIDSERAQAEAETRRQALMAASKQKRQAQRLVEISRVRARLDARRNEQKAADDANCARASHCGIAS